MYYNYYNSEHLKFIISLSLFIFQAETVNVQGHVIVKHNLLFFHVDWEWVSFFCYALKYDPFVGCFKMIYCAIILRIIRSAYINHFETPTNLSYVRA